MAPVVSPSHPLSRCPVLSCPGLPCLRPCPAPSRALKLCYGLLLRCCAGKYYTICMWYVLYVLWWLPRKGTNEQKLGFLMLPHRPTQYSNLLLAPTPAARFALPISTKLFYLTLTIPHTPYIVSGPALRRPASLPPSLPPLPTHTHISLSSSCSAVATVWGRDRA